MRLSSQSNFIYHKFIAKFLDADIFTEKQQQSYAKYDEIRE